VLPAKAVGWNEMPFGRDTHVIPSNMYGIRWASGLSREARIWGWNPQFAVMPPIDRLLWPLLLLLFCVIHPSMV